MGAEQSNNNNARNNTPQPPQMSEAEVNRLLEQQRMQFERKLLDVVNKTNAQNAPQNAQTASIERERAPYSYSGNALQQNLAPQPAARPLYPNLNHAPSSSPHAQYYNQVNNNAYRPPQPPQDYVFVNNFGQTGSFNRPAPSAPSAPPAQPAPRGSTPRPRSVSRPRSNGPRERDVLDCPTCFSRYGMKIFQCDSGHSSCNDCKVRGRACGICRQSLTNRRNFEMENHMAQTKAPCPHSSEGCKLFIKVIDMESHVRECPFKEQECPLAAIFGTCRWKGKLSQLSSHFDNMHPSGRQTDVDSEMTLTNVRNNSQSVHLVVLGVYNFLFHVKVSEPDGKIYMAVQLIGTKMSASKWIYEIHVYNKNENRRKYMYTDNCSSSSEKVEDLFREGDCAVLPIWYATTFIYNEAVTYKFFIKKTNEGRKDFGKNQRGRDDSKQREEDKEKRKSNADDIETQPTRQWVNSRRGRSSSRAT